MNGDAAGGDRKERAASVALPADHGSDGIGTELSQAPEHAQPLGRKLREERNVGEVQHVGISPA
jgi:hypothetical protein